MSDLVIIHPGGARQTYEQLAAEFAAVEPPLWARLIAGYVRDRGYSVEIIDAEAFQVEPETVAYKTSGLRPKLVCIAAYGHQPSASTQSMPAVYATARAIKKRRPELPIIVVGGHVSALPERTLNEEPALNFACVGEGPITITGLLSGAKVEDIPGLAFRLGAGGIHVNPSTALLDLKYLRGNAWDLLPMERYRAHNWQCLGDFTKRQPYASIYTTLGCPYKCPFCCIHAPFESNRYRMRDPKEVVAEIEMLYRDYGVRTFKITDEMFLLNERHYTTIAAELINTGITPDINIWAYARVDTIKPHTLKLLRTAGIRWLALGIESGSAHVRDGADKNFGEDQIIANVCAIRASDINVIANYIFGLPDDDWDTMQATLDLSCDLNTEWANFYSAMAYPGSPLYGQAVREGWRLPKQWSGYSQHSRDCLPLDTHHVKGPVVLQFRDEAFHRYFTRPAYLNMIRRRFGQAAVEHIQAMVEHRLRRDVIEDLALA